MLSLGVSIVLYKTLATDIRELLEQLLEQGASRIYLIDNSPLSYRTFAGWSPSERITIVRTGHNLGYGSGHNLAIRDSLLRHHYHLICNPDIQLLPGTLAAIHDTMTARPDVGLCMPKVLGLDRQIQHVCKRAPSPLDYLAGILAPRGWGRRRRFRFEMRDCSYEQEMEVECLSGCFMFFRSTTLESLAGFDEHFFLYFEDFDLSRRARQAARNLYFPGAAVIHAHARAHSHSWRLRWMFARSALRYFNKWGWW